MAVAALRSAIHPALQHWHLAAIAALLTALITAALVHAAHADSVTLSQLAVIRLDDGALLRTHGVRVTCLAPGAQWVTCLKPQSVVVVGEENGVRVGRYIGVDGIPRACPFALAWHSLEASCHESHLPVKPLRRVETKNVGG